MGATLVAWSLYEFGIFSERMVSQPIPLCLGLPMVEICAAPSLRRYRAVPSVHGGDPR